MKATKPKKVSVKRKKPIQTNELQMHRAPHGDEIVGGALIRGPEGAKLFPGADAAAIRFVEKDVDRTDAQFDADGIVPIGCGGKVRFNDHQGPSARIPGECSATLVASYLGIRHEPEYERLLNETLANDTEPHARRTQLAEIVKMMNRQMVQNSLAIYNWGVQAVDAIIIRERYGYAAVTSEATLKHLFDVFEKKMKGGDSRVLDWMKTEIKNSMDNAKWSVTELAFMVQSLFRRPSPDGKQAYTANQVNEWCQTAFTCMYNDQLAFWRTVDEITKKVVSFDVDALLLGKQRKLRVAVVACNDSHALKATRYVMKERAKLEKAAQNGHAVQNGDVRASDDPVDVILIRQESGNGQFFTNKNVRGLNLADVTRMVRLLEAEGGDKESGCWTDLGSGGNHPIAPHWYYDKQGEMLACGTDTHDQIPSLIATQAFIEVLQYGFHPDGVRMWLNDRNFRIYRDRDDRKLYWNMGFNRRSRFRRRLAEPSEPQAVAGTNSIADALDEARSKALAKAKAKKAARTRRTKADKGSKKAVARS